MNAPKERAATLRTLGLGDVRSADHRRRRHRRRHRARRGAARAQGGARREDRLRGGHVVEVVEAGARRPALSRARAVPPGVRGHQRARAAHEGGAAPGAPARVPLAGLQARQAGAVRARRRACGSTTGCRSSRRPSCIAPCARRACGKLEPGLKRDELDGGAALLRLRHRRRALTLENILDARALGATIVNYTRAVKLLARRRPHRRRRGASRPTWPTTAATVPVRAKVTINATGPWTDDVRRLAGENGDPARVQGRAPGRRRRAAARRATRW